MQLTTTLALLIAAVGIDAAPAAELTKRLDAIPLSIGKKLPVQTKCGLSKYIRDI
jgi:hypothetical protein